MVIFHPCDDLCYCTSHITHGVGIKKQNKRIGGCNEGGKRTQEADPVAVRGRIDRVQRKATVKV